MTHIIKWGLVNTLCIVNVVSILLVVNHWLPLNPMIFKVVIFALVIMGIVSTILLSAIPNSILIYEKIINILYYASFALFGICLISAIANISRFGLERGTALYDSYSLPAIFPVISGMVLYFLKK